MHEILYYIFIVNRWHNAMKQAVDEFIYESILLHVLRKYGALALKIRGYFA